MHAEIERRWIVQNGCPESFPVSYTDYRIQQMYLTTSGDGWKDRVRRTQNLETGEVYHTYTRKSPRPEGIGNMEIEVSISESSYLDYLKRIDTSRTPVCKVRRVFQMEPDGLTFELDMFEEGLTGLVILEVELDTDDTPVSVPEFLGPVVEVTKDKRFSNRALARNGMPS